MLLFVLVFVLLTASCGAGHRSAGGGQNVALILERQNQRCIVRWNRALGPSEQMNPGGGNAYGVAESYFANPDYDGAPAFVTLVNGRCTVEIYLSIEGGASYFMAEPGAGGFAQIGIETGNHVRKAANATLSRGRLVANGSASTSSPASSPPAATTVDGGGGSSSTVASSASGTCVGSAGAAAQNLRISAADRAALLTAYKATSPAREHDRGPVTGSVYFGRVRGEEWAVATFAGPSADLGDQPEAFKRPVGPSTWTDIGDNAPSLPLPCALLRVWHLTAWPSYRSA